MHKGVAPEMKLDDARKYPTDSLRMAPLVAGLARNPLRQNQRAAQPAPAPVRRVAHQDLLNHQTGADP